jgi:hypothetical protein
MSNPFASSFKIKLYLCLFYGSKNYSRFTTHIEMHKITRKHVHDHHDFHNDLPVHVDQYNPFP